MQLSAAPPPPQHAIRVTFTETFDESHFEHKESYGLNPVLARSIVDNRPELIVDEHKPNNNLTEMEFDPQAEVQKSGVEYRQKYDKIKTHVHAVEEKIKQLRVEQQRLQEQKRLLETHKKQTKESLVTAETRVIDTAYRADQSVLRMDSNAYSEDRLKKDILFYKKNIFEKNLELLKKKQDIKRSHKRSERQNRMSLRCRTLLSSVEKTLTKNREERGMDLNYASRTASKKLEYSFMKEEQEMQIQSQVLSAVYDRTPMQKEEKKLLVTHKLLKRMLHDRMQRLLAQHESTNQVFLNIKKNTDIKTAADIVERYLTKDVTYGKLLESVSAAEVKISACKEEHAKLKKQQHKLEKKQAEIEELFEHRQVKEFERKKIELDKLNEQLLKNERNTTLWRSWTVTMVSMLSNTPKQKVEKQNIKFVEFVSGCLQLVLPLIQSERENETSLAEQRLKKQQERTSIPATEMLKRNVRIRTVGEESARREDEDMDYDLISEKDYLQVSRRMVKKQRYARGNRNHTHHRV